MNIGQSNFNSEAEYLVHHDLHNALGYLDLHDNMSAHRVLVVGERYTDLRGTYDVVNLHTAIDSPLPMGKVAVFTDPDFADRDYKTTMLRAYVDPDAETGNGSLPPLVYEDWEFIIRSDINTDNSSRFFYLTVDGWRYQLGYANDICEAMAIPNSSISSEEPKLSLTLISGNDRRTILSNSGFNPISVKLTDDNDKVYFDTVLSTNPNALVPVTVPSSGSTHVVPPTPTLGGANTNYHIYMDSTEDNVFYFVNSSEADLVNVIGAFLATSPETISPVDIELITDGVTSAKLSNNLSVPVNIVVGDDKGNVYLELTLLEKSEEVTDPDSAQIISSGEYVVQPDASQGLGLRRFNLRVANIEYDIPGEFEDVSDALVSVAAALESTHAGFSVERFDGSDVYLANASESELPVKLTDDTSRMYFNVVLAPTAVPVPAPVTNPSSGHIHVVTQVPTTGGHTRRFTLIIGNTQYPVIGVSYDLYNGILAAVQSVSQTPQAITNVDIVPNADDQTITITNLTSSALPIKVVDSSGRVYLDLTLALNPSVAVPAGYTHKLAFDPTAGDLHNYSVYINGNSYTAPYPLASIDLVIKSVVQDIYPNSGEDHLTVALDYSTNEFTFTNSSINPLSVKIVRDDGLVMMNVIMASPPAPQYSEWVASGTIDVSPGTIGDSQYYTIAIDGQEPFTTSDTCSQITEALYYAAPIIEALRPGVVVYRRDTPVWTISNFSGEIFDIKVTDANGELKLWIALAAPYVPAPAPLTTPSNGSYTDVPELTTTNMVGQLFYIELPGTTIQTSNVHNSIYDALAEFTAYVGPVGFMVEYLNPTICQISNTRTTPIKVKIYDDTRRVYVDLTLDGIVEET